MSLDGGELDVLAEQMARLAAGELDARLPEGGDHGEFAALAAGLNMLADDLQAKEDRAVAAESALREALAEQTRRLDAVLARSQHFEALGRLTSGLVHDLNNVFGVVVATAAVLKLDVDSREDREMLDDMVRAVERGSGLAVDLLAFGRPSTPRSSEPAPIGPTFDYLGRLLSRTLGPSVALSVTYGELPRLPASQIPELEDAIVNLVMNARDALSHGGRVVLRVAAVTLGTPPGPGVCIEVEDGGHGMSPEVVARALEPYFTTKPEGRGTGLGLAQVQAYAERVGGQVHIRSTVGEGTTVTLELPATA